MRNTMSQPVSLSIDGKRKAAIRRRLLRWFAAHKRDLPWRAEPRDPYHVWLAEIMLQQTQVATVIPYYRRWLARFPTLADLADAPLDDVLKLWEGLGYYSRARNLHRAAQVVMRDYGGQLPATVDALRKLPGIGRYTAGAIASLAFQQAAPILDGNVARVLSRVFAIEQDVKAPQTINRLWALSAELLPSQRAGEFNEALMDHGATICTPRAPRCPACPIRLYCFAYAKGNPEAYPVKAARKETPHKDVATAVIFDAEGRLLMAQRPAPGLLGGLWEFPGGEVTIGADTASASLAAQLRSIIHDKTGLRVRVQESDFIGVVKHGFTHFQMTRHVAVVGSAQVGGTLRVHTDGQHDSAGAYTNLRWVTRAEIAGLALTRSDQRIVGMALSTD
jgi:A/G-specific adenine glycosylase